MAEAVVTPNAAIPKPGKTVAVALLMGLSIQLIGTMAWVGLIGLNVREHPDVPWAAATQACLLVLMLVWLSGRGWPRSTSALRRCHLRLWQPQPGAWSGDSLAAILGLIGALVGLSVDPPFIGNLHRPASTGRCNRPMQSSRGTRWRTRQYLVEQGTEISRHHRQRRSRSWNNLVTVDVHRLAH